MDATVVITWKQQVPPLRSRSLASVGMTNLRDDKLRRRR
jgi:hypothetical protein